MKQLIPLLSLLIVGCVYDPPPLPTLQQPEQGVFMVGDSLVVQFSEAIEPESLQIQIWPVGPDDITLENEFIEGLTPALPECTLADSPCGDITLTLDESRTEMVIDIQGDDFAKVKVPWRLEISAGLKDDKGLKTAVPYYFDFQFAPGDNLQSSGDVEFDSGQYVLLSVIEDPLPAVLNLLCDIQAMDDGHIRIACANGKPIDGAAKNTANPEELFVDTTGNGFAIFAEGVVTQDGDTRYLQTEEFQVHIAIGPIMILLDGVRLSGVIVKGIEDPPDYPVLADQDWIEGTISYQKIALDSGGEPFEYPPGNTTFFAQGIPTESIPEGVPAVCGDLCGEVTAQCNPPEDYPGETFCADLNAQDTE